MMNKSQMLGAFGRTLLFMLLIREVQAVGPVLTNSILFVTQVPMPAEANATTVTNVIVSVASPLGNHLGDTAHAARGGDLWIRYPDGALKTSHAPVVSA